MRIKTSELTGAALDWAVAKCEPDSTLEIYFDNETGEPLCHDDWSDNQEFRPSTDWAQGGPIIERERMTVEFFEDGNYPGGGAWLSTHIIRPYFNEEIGPTPLIAAMRCYVASKLGDYIDIPEELTP